MEVTLDMIHSALNQIPSPNAFQATESKAPGGAQRKKINRISISQEDDHILKEPAKSSKNSSTDVIAENAPSTNLTRKTRPTKDRESPLGKRPRSPDSASDSTSGSKSSESDSTESETGYPRKSSSLKGAGVRRRQRVHHTGGGAKCYRVPHNEEFPIGLEKAISEVLKQGNRKLNSLQMQKFLDTTNALQGMNTHKLEPLTQYSMCQLYDLMASMAECWKNSGKTAWKKRIHKIRENARYRKQPRQHTLDKCEIEEITELEKKIKEREAWEKRVKAEIDAQKAKLKKKKKGSKGSKKKVEKKKGKAVCS